MADVMCGELTYVINEAARVKKKRAMARTRPENPDARRLQGASREVKKAITSKKSAMR